MEDVLINTANIIIGLVIGAVSGYAMAYFREIRDVRRGMQLMLRSCLNDMYCRFQTKAPTADDKQAFEEMYVVYERLGDNGVMDIKHKEVLMMKERLK